MQKGNISTAYRQELREKILKASMHEFMTKGIKAVKMDDIAKHLSISKRTLYEIYSNKEELLLAGMTFHEQQCEQRLTSYAADPRHSVVDVILEYYRMQMRNMVDVTPLVFAEISTYKQVFAYLEGRRRRRDEQARLFFARGVQEGFFRADVDYGIVAAIAEASLNHVMEARMYEHHDLAYIFQNIVFLFVRGFCTQKGIRIVDAFLGEKGA